MDLILFLSVEKKFIIITKIAGIRKTRWWVCEEGLIKSMVKDKREKIITFLFDAFDLTSLLWRYTIGNIIINKQIICRYKFKEPGKLKMCVINPDKVKYIISAVLLFEPEKEPRMKLFI